MRSTGYPTSGRLVNLRASHEMRLLSSASMRISSSFVLTRKARRGTFLAVGCYTAENASRRARTSSRCTASASRTTCAVTSSGRSAPPKACCPAREALASALLLRQNVCIHVATSRLASAADGHPPASAMEAMRRTTYTFSKSASSTSSARIITSCSTWKWGNSSCASWTRRGSGSSKRSFSPHPPRATSVAPQTTTTAQETNGMATKPTVTRILTVGVTSIAAVSSAWATKRASRDVAAA
mmetsp:Transcript_69856/g.155684  ORF Transcript_69856/g.155684 Transcript_69856/m.155684 type:complete len:241 (-) Transcript_69856:569-1291(-)